MREDPRVKPTLDKFCEWLRDGKIRRDPMQAAGWLVVLGAAAPFLGMSFESLQKAVSFIFRNKGEEVINMNLKALQAGFAVTTRQMS